jgi:uncharacterized protein YkwD
MTASGGCGRESNGKASSLTPGTATAEVLAMEQQVHDLINQERALYSKPPLTMDPALIAVARAHSEDMRDRDFFAHTNPDSKSPFDRMSDAGVSYSAAAENIAYNYGYPDPAQTAVTGWMNSPGHRANILDEGAYGFTLTGVGVAVDSSGQWWFTQLFKKP